MVLRGSRAIDREEGVIDASKRAFAHRVPMIIHPTTNLWVELIDQIGRHAMYVFDGDGLPVTRAQGPRITPGGK